jgi:aminopeptidase
VRLVSARLQGILLREGTEAQLRHVSELDWRGVEHYDALLNIRAAEHPRAAVGAGGDRGRREMIYQEAVAPLGRRQLERAAEGALRWCTTTYPTAVAAQEAGMSPAEYQAVLFGAGLLDREDAVAAWEELRAEQRRLAGLLESEGERAEGVRLRFERGRVVAATAERGQAFLDAMLAADAGARGVGELAFGTNPGLRRFTGDTALDEKMAGTMHLALGHAAPGTGGTNQSRLHWDVVWDMREGRVIADGELIYERGRFTI